MAEKLYKKPLVEAGGGPGGGGGARPSWRGNTLGLKGLRPAPRGYKPPAPEPSTPPRTSTDRMDYLQGKARQSMEDTGGYPTSGGVPKMTKMQQRMEARKAAAEAEPIKKREQFKFNKGGKVPGRDYCK